MQASDLLRKLQKKGLKLKIGHKKSNLSPRAALVVYNQAIPYSNPELKEARRLGVRTLTYPGALGGLTRMYKTIAVAGAHGKSTTTALISLVLVKAGLDPTVIIGTKLKEFGDSNFRKGKSDYLVIEADEFKASFHNYSPTYAIITNIDAEHLDFYKNVANVKKSFLKFIGNIKSGGVLVVNQDDKNLRSLKSKIQKISKHKNFGVIWYGVVTRHNTHRRIKRVLKIPGEHNVSNALAVFTLARTLGIKEQLILKALGSYRGAWRRFEYRGHASYRIQNTKYSIPVYDDYAHHPTEIKATLQAFREKFPTSPAGGPRRKIICVFQPHQAHRTQNLFKDFISAFDSADYLILLPIYQVAGRDKPHKGYSSADLAKAITKRTKIPKAFYLSNHKKIKARRLNPKSYILNPENVFYLPSPRRLRRFFIENFKLKIENCVIVMMGAGDIVNYTDSLVKN